MTRQFHLWLGLLLAGVLVLGGTACSAPRSSPAPVTGPAAGPLAGSVSGPAVAPASAPGAPQEGIKVHGRWTIEVTNPDGSLAERREFDNALSSFGATTLGLVIGRQTSVGGWRVNLMSPTGQNVFMDASNNASQGILTESTDTISYPYVFKTLTVDVPTSGANQNKLVLSGTATAQRTGKINRVMTYVTRLAATSAPSGSYSGTIWQFTSTTLAAVNLSIGQQVAVTVVMSFS